MEKISKDDLVNFYNLNSKILNKVKKIIIWKNNNNAYDFVFSIKFSANGLKIEKVFENGDILVSNDFGMVVRISSEELVSDKFEEENKEGKVSE